MENLLIVWMDTINPKMRQSIVQWLQGETGKRGCLYLKGVPNSGKSIITRMIAALIGYDNCGIVQRGSENRFWLQNIEGKSLVIAEEFIMTDLEADQLKLHFEGSPFATIERKNKPAKRITPRIPWIVTSNLEITCMAPRHTAAIYERVLKFDFNIIHPHVKEISKTFYTLDEQELRSIAVTVLGL